MAIPLSPLESSFWHHDSDTSVQEIAAFCPLDSAPDVALLAAKVEQLILMFPELRRRISWNGRHAQWVEDEEFSVARHINVVDAAGEPTKDSVLEQASLLLSERLDEARPPWRINVVRYPGSTNILPDGIEPRAAMMLQLHHSLTDGLGLLDMVSLLTSDSQAGSLLPGLEHVDRSEAKLGGYRQPERRFATAVRYVSKVVSDLLTRPGSSPLNGTNSPERRIFTLDLPFQDIHQIKSVFRTSLNDILLTVVAGGVREYHRLLGKPTDDLRVTIPVSTRLDLSQKSLGNNLTVVGVPLPISLPDPREQLQHIRDYFQRMKSSGVVGAYLAASRVTARFPEGILKHLHALQAGSTNFICTNMPGPKKAQYLAGSHVLGQYGCAALLQSHGTSFAFISYAGKICITLITDPGIVRRPQAILDFMHESADKLLRLAR